MSKTYRNESTGRHDFKARVNAMRGYRPLKQRERDQLREQAFDLVYAKRARA